MTNTPQTPTIEEIEQRLNTLYGYPLGDDPKALKECIADLCEDGYILLSIISRLQSELTEVRAFTDVLTKAQDELTQKTEEESEQIPKWISVKERLPEADDNWFGFSAPVLVIEPESDIPLIGQYNDLEKNWIFGGGSGANHHPKHNEHDALESEFVTHWQPLPEPPKE